MSKEILLRNQEINAIKRDPAEKIPKIRYLSRREMLGLMGSATAAVVFVSCEPEQSSSGEKMGVSVAGTPGGTTAETASSCVVKPEQTEGP